MAIYPVGASIALLYFLIGYIMFTGLYRRRNKEANPEETAMLAELCSIRRTPLLYRNPLAATPMLFGVLRPSIILPDREYTAEQLRAVLLHELTHLRRKDVLVKWLSVLSCAAHWFNPVVWLMRREIDRACELACDSSVVFSLDADGRQIYGETLIYVAADSKTPHAVLSTTMCEEKKALKERLGAIMKSKKHTRIAIVLSAALIIAVSGTAIALGAGRGDTLKSGYSFDTFIVNAYKLHGYMDDETIS
jgi:beta-lactamase regulating signal transducer with metallopeptidase domain